MIDEKKLYKDGTESQFQNKEIKLGPWTSYSLMTDPKHMCFVLSRYKFCAKMLHGRNILEVGCGDGFGLPILADAAKYVWAVDWDARNVEGIKKRLSHIHNVSYKQVDFNEESYDGFGDVDSVVAIDVIEHINPEKEKHFMDNIIDCYTEREKAVMLMGTPNITASAYQSKQSKIQHINLKSMETLQELMSNYFENVFLFGQNDEVIHTGYAPMCHYIWAMGVCLRKQK